MQVSRGHRRTDLFDVNEYPPRYMLPSLDITPEGFMMSVRPCDTALMAAVNQMKGKMQATLDLCKSVAAERSSCRIIQKWVDYRLI